MRIEYFPQTDTLNIDLVGRTGADAQEIADGVAYSAPDCSVRGVRSVSG
jgi:hypothetical protein